MRALGRLLLPQSVTARWMLLAAGMGLAAALLALLLLAVSGWLITASALAGIGVLAALDIFAPGAIIRAAAVGRTVTRYLERLIGHEATFRQLAEIRIRAFKRLMGQSIARLDALGRGDTLSRLTRDVDVLDHVFPRLVLPSVAALGAALLAVAVFLALAPRAALVLGVIVVGGGVLVLAVGTHLARTPGRRLAAATPAMRSAMAEWLYGLGELISVGRAGERAGTVMDAVEQQVQAQVAQRRIEAVMQAGIAFFGYLGFWLVLLLALSMYDAGALRRPWWPEWRWRCWPWLTSGCRWRRAGAFSKPVAGQRCGSMPFSRTLAVADKANPQPDRPALACRPKGWSFATPGQSTR